MSLNGMAESRRLWCHRRVWLKCSKTVARELQVLPVRACRWFNRATKTTRQAQAPSPVFFIEAPGRPVFFLALRMRGDGAPGGAAVVGSRSASPCGNAEAPPGAPPEHVQCPGSFAAVFFRFAH